MALRNATAIYRAVVVDNNDPLKANRVLMKVPQVLGNATSMWAKPQSYYQYAPPVGSEVWASFDGGDVRYPIYSAPSIQPYGDGVNGRLRLQSPPPYGAPATETASLELQSSVGGPIGNSWINLQATNTNLSNDLNVGGDTNITGDLNVTGHLSVTGIGARVFVYKTLTENYASNTAMHNDAELFCTLQALAVYHIVFLIGANGPDNGFTTAWTVPSGTTGTKHCVGPTSVVADGASRANTRMRLQGTTSLSGGVIYSVDHGAEETIREEGILFTGTTTGTLRLQWAQVTSSSTPTVVSNGSYLIATRIG